MELTGGVWPAMFTPLTDERQPDLAMIEPLKRGLSGSDYLSVRVGEELPI